MTPPIHIDRLILDMPTLSPAQTEELAHAIAAALSSLSPGTGSFPGLSIELDEPGTDLPFLASRIADSIAKETR